MSNRLTTRNTADRTDAGLMRTPIEEVQNDDAFNNGYQYTRHSLHGSAQAEEKKTEQQKDIENASYPYGMVARVQPPTGKKPNRQAAEGLMIFPTNTRSHGVVIANGDRRYRLYKLKNGEVALHDDQGHQVHIARDGLYASAPNSKKIVLQIMQDDALPQESTKQNTVNGKKLGQIPQKGRAVTANAIFDKDSLTINHPGAVNINAGSITMIASGNINLKASKTFTVGKTYLGVDKKDEVVEPKVPDTDMNPSKQTYVKII